MKQPDEKCVRLIPLDRIRIVNNEATYGIARWIQAHGPVTTANSRRYAALIRNTIDFLAAGVAAPIGESGAGEPRR